MSNEQDRYIDAKERFEERAGIIEDSHVSREDAERRAKIEVAEWLRATKKDEVQP